MVSVMWKFLLQAMSLNFKKHLIIFKNRLCRNVLMQPFLCAPVDLWF